jgi:dihydroflavonol-4-reductase
MKERVLVTGIGGFIALHVAKNLLDAGYRVRGTARSTESGEKARSALKNTGADVSRLEIVTADLGSDAGWDEAVRDCPYIQHVAAPFPMQQPKGRHDLVPETRQGALRVLDAARNAGAKRVVFTSSVVAMMYRAGRSGTVDVTEDDWSDPEWGKASPYIISKTLAERAVWEWADAHGWRDRIVSVNPGFVQGPAIDARAGTSMEAIRLIMNGAYPAVPRINFTVVDVRDLAEIHVRAMTADGAAGRRLLAAGETMSMADTAQTLRENLPEYAERIPTKTFPDFVIRSMALLDRSLKTLLPDLGVIPRSRAEATTSLTGVRFRPARESIVDAGKSLIEHGMVDPPRR